MERNLTKGNVLKKIIMFSLPYLISCFLQTFYGLADLFITGQFNGADSITAVSVGSQVMHMLTVIIVGLAMGSSVVIARFVGENNKEQIGNAISNTVIMFVGFSVILTSILLMSVNGINTLLQVPSEALLETKNYLLVCFIGIPFIVGYNVTSSVFRGLGDSKTPMWFIFIAGIINIILDCFLIGPFHLGAFGAAVATVVAQAISFILSVIYIKYFSDIFRYIKVKLKTDFSLMKRMAYVGLPIALQDGFIQIAFMVITIIANTRGVEIAAAVGIVEKIIGFIFLVPSAMLSTVSALSAQNAGAGKHDRAKQSLFYGITIGFVFGIVVSIICQFLSKDIVGMFTDNVNVIVYGDQYLRSYIWDSAVAAIQFCFSGFFVAYQKSFISFIHNVISIITVRIPGAYLASIYYKETLFPMGMAAPLGSLLSSIICVIAYRIWFYNKKID